MGWKCEGVEGWGGSVRVWRGGVEVWRIVSMAVYVEQINS